jgi:hypothetical protein
MTSPSEVPACDYDDALTSNLVLEAVAKYYHVERIRPAEILLKHYAPLLLVARGEGKKDATELDLIEVLKTVPACPPELVAEVKAAVLSATKAVEMATAHNLEARRILAGYQAMLMKNEDPL